MHHVLDQHYQHFRFRTVSSPWRSSAITGTRKCHAYVTPKSLLLLFPACEGNIKKSCLSHAFWSSPILNASVKTTLSKSELFISAVSFPPCHGDSRILLCPLSSQNRFTCMGCLLLWKGCIPGPYDFVSVSGFAFLVCSPTTLWVAGCSGPPGRTLLPLVSRLYPTHPHDSTFVAWCAWWLCRYRCRRGQGIYAWKNLLCVKASPQKLALCKASLCKSLLSVKASLCKRFCV